MNRTMRNRLRLIVSRVFIPGLVFLPGLTSIGFAQRNLKDVPSPDIKVELASFRVPEGMVIELYAGDGLISKPIQMNFDSAGRLWVVSSPLYPHLKPGDVANDRVLVLEDRDGDGRADSSTVFAEDLLMPTGLEIGDGGIYVANSTEVLFLADHDGDGKADERRVVLSGFGTEDTHHIIHTFRFGYDGSLYFNQSIYIHSNVETPHGVRRMNGGGIWRFRTDSLQLEPFCYGFINAWGHVFDYWGQNFATDGAGGEGVNFVIPGATYSHSPRPEPILHGLNPGSPKYCGAEIISGRHFPENWQGDLITGDFRAHRVCRFKIRDDGSGFAAKQLQDIVVSKHIAFRPIDMKMGPDGALYIADWYNPIIQHGEVSFRDERRNHVNGRIWRLRVRDRELLDNPRLDRMTISRLFDQLAQPEQWTRHHARRELLTRLDDEVIISAASRVNRLEDGSPDSDHLRVELLWIYQALGVVKADLLRAVLRSHEPRARAAGVRVLGSWMSSIPHSLDWLAAAVLDEFPRVRLEAVRALSKRREARAAELATLALDSPIDGFIDYALSRCLNELAPIWLPALQAAELDFDGDIRRLEYALRASGSGEVAGSLAKLLDRDNLSESRRRAIVRTLAAVGGPVELELVMSHALGAASDGEIVEAVSLLEQLRETWVVRQKRPGSGLASIGRLFDAESENLRRAALGLAGSWRVEALRGAIVKVARENGSDADTALRALANLGGKASAAELRSLAASHSVASLRISSIAALVRIDVKSAAESASKALRSPQDADALAALFAAFLAHRDGASALSKSLRSRNNSISVDAAKIGIRAIRASGHAHEELAGALASAAVENIEERNYSDPEKRTLLAAIDTGDAQRGELVFRRADLRCMSCHSLGGSGGRVGPDLSTIGASAPTDYILDSLLEPGKAVKEGYHAATVVTDRGTVITGVQVRRDKNETVLRTTDDVLTLIPARSILSYESAGSLMPSGLADSITKNELVDLMSFLTVLGRREGFRANSDLNFRTWRVLSNPTPGLARLDAASLAARLSRESLNWERTYSRISGKLAIEDGSGASVYARTSVKVTTAGAIQFRFDNAGGLRLWIDGKPQKVERRMRVELTQGDHILILEVSREGREALRLTLEDVPDSPARARPILGR